MVSFLSIVLTFVSLHAVVQRLIIIQYHVWLKQGFSMLIIIQYHVWVKQGFSVRIFSIIIYWKINPRVSTWKSCKRIVILKKLYMLKYWSIIIIKLHFHILYFAFHHLKFLAFPFEAGSMERTFLHINCDKLISRWFYNYVYNYAYYPSLSTT